MGFPINSTRYLIVSAAQRLCALNLADVIETFRPLPIVTVASAPAFVRGVSVVRGNGLPVVELAQLLGGVSRDARRMVTLRVASRSVALLVEDVLGVRGLEPSQVAAAPGLLGEVAGELLSALGQLDEKLLVVLQAAHVVPPEVWSLLERSAPLRGQA